MFFVAIALFQISFVIAVIPFGANLTELNTETAQGPDPESIPAQAGNVTELNIFGYTTTQSWQGYFGNVTGTIQLADASDNIMYNWSLASPEGEIYATVSNSVDWSGIECFNFTANGTDLEASFNITPSDVDGVNETFSYNNGHDLFYTNHVEFIEGECMSTQLFDNTGKGVDDYFEEILLWDGSDVVFTTLLEENALGFDGGSHDFEMIVLEDGHSNDVDITPYYFYVELQ